MRNSLHDAASAGNSNKALALLKGDPALVFSKDENDATSLHHAARGEPNRYTHDGHLAVAKLLIAHAADVNARDKQEFTSLFCAAGSGNVEFAEALLVNGADVNSRGYSGQTPLHLAANTTLADQNFKSLGAAMASLLINHQADVNATDHRGDTPLHYAANIGNVLVVEVLLANRANVGLTDDTGSTPLKYATSKGHSAVAERLRRAEPEKAGLQEHSFPQPSHLFVQQTTSARPSANASRLPLFIRRIFRA